MTTSLLVRYALALLAVPLLATVNVVRAQTTYAITAGGQRLATEQISTSGDSITVLIREAHAPKSVGGLLVEHAGKPVSFSIRQHVDTGRHDGYMTISFSDSLASGEWNKEGIQGSATLRIDRNAPLLVFENMMFGMVASQLPRIAATNQTSIQVLIASAFTIQTWTTYRRETGAFVLVAPSGLEMEFLLDGGHLKELLVPSQRVRVAPLLGPSAI